MPIDNQPRTSIVIPAYNAERFIERTLLSALRQTFENLDIIVVNDGSNDRTLQIAESIALIDKRVRIVTIPNGGVANARNVGLQSATGELVAFLDADDLWHPRKIELQVAMIRDTAHEVSPAAVYTLSRTIDTEDKLIGYRPGVLIHGYAFARHLYLRPVGNGSSILVKSEIAREVGGFDPSWAARKLGGCEDLDFELRIAAKYPIAALGLYLVGYRAYPGNMSSNGVPMALGAIATMSRNMELGPALPPWVTRLIRASILEYALYTLIAGRHWRLAIERFVQLSETHPGRALQFAAGFPTRKLHRWISAFHSLPPQETRASLFSELDPASDPHGAADTRSSKELRIIESLSKVDRRLTQNPKTKPR